MGLFDNCSVVLELKHLPFKEKKRLLSSITDNGGSIAYVVNKQCTLIVTSSLSDLSSSRVRSLKKHQTPVVRVEYVSCCLERGVRLPVEDYSLAPSPSVSPTISLVAPRPVPSSTSEPRPKVQSQTWNAVNQAEGAGSQGRSGTYLDKFRVYSGNDSDLPTYPPHFKVAKYSIFEKAGSGTWWVLELQSCRGEGGEQLYRVVRYWREDLGAKSTVQQDKLVFCSTSEEAVDVFQSLGKGLQVRGQLRTSLPAQAQDLGSASLQQLLLEEKLNCGAVSQEVGVFVELLWTEALGSLSNILKIPVTSISLNDVSRVEGLLLQVQKRLREGEGEGGDTMVVSLMGEVYTLLPHRLPCPPVNARLVSQKLDLCQLIRDMLNVSEATLRSPSPSCLGKYRALRCSIETVPSDSPEFTSVSKLLQDRPVKILQVLCVSRGVELQMFREELGNVKPLLHSSNPSSFVGILSRGLLLPRVGVEHHGVERTDQGNLGSGIYFSDTMSTSVKYSKPSVTDGSRLLLVCDVALGRCHDHRRRDTTLSHAPEGYHSVHGVRRTPSKHSDFEDDEYVVYSPDQVRLRYLVQFSLEEDQVKEFHPSIDISSELAPPTSDLLSTTEGEEGVGSHKNPLDDVTAGLLDSSGQPLPLEAVHVKCRLMDLLSQVIIFQKYTNQSAVPIEAKYVFPLDDSAAVCGFEAFINGKHVVGKVKEKEQARKEYKQAIEKGHGAYLMDQDAPDVFTISVGNLPPGATVLIKVTFISELVVRAGSILFSLPGSVAPWQQSAAVNQTTQVTVEKVCVTELATQGEFTLDMSIDMPYEVINLRCVTHKVKIKRTDCRAVLSTCPGETLGPDGFQLSFSMSNIHLPRMWVENHPEKDSQACMLVFYPDFDSSHRLGPNSGSCSPSPDSGPISNPSEVVLLLDTSESMGEALLDARRLALQVLNSLDRSVRVNIIVFGTDQKEAFLSAQPLAKALQPAKQFIMTSPPVGGSTELWRPLRSLSLLPPSRGVRNLLLLSDGHIQNQVLTLQLLRDQAQHSRLFTCGLSPTANRHMLRALAQAGGGAYEFFDTKTKHTWAEKMGSQVKRMASPGCSSISVKWQQFNPTAPSPVQAPTQLHALFNNCQTLVYGFVPHCTQATLLGDLSGQEIKTMVSTSELQKTRGTFLHKLTARAVIRDYEDGSLHTDEAEHEGKKAELKSFIIELSKEFSILSQFTSFVAIEERDSGQPEAGFTDVPKIISQVDVDFLPYLSWEEEKEEEIYEDMGMDMMDAEHTDMVMMDEELMTVLGSCMMDDDREREDSTTYDPTERVCYMMDEEEEEGDTLDVYDFVGSAPTVKLDGKREYFATQLESHVTHFGFLGRPRKESRMQSAKSSMPLGTVDCDGAPVSTSPVGMPEVQSPRIMNRSLSFNRQAAHQASPPRPPSFSRCLAAEDIQGSLDVKNAYVAGRPNRLMKTSLLPRAGYHDLLAIVADPLDEILPPRRMKRMSSFRSYSAVVTPSPPPPGGRLQSGPAVTDGPQLSGGIATAQSSARLHSQVRASSPHAVGGPPGGVSFYMDSAPAMGYGFMAGPPARSHQAIASVSFGTVACDSAPVSTSLVGIPELQPLHLKFCPISPATVRLDHVDTQGSHTPSEAYPCFRRKALSRSRKAVVDTAKWPKIFNLQHSEGYWECSPALGALLGVDVVFFVNIFLKKKGISSLGVRAHADILRLVATLLVLQLMRVKRLEEGKLLQSLFRLDHAPPPRSERWEAVRRAVDWACWADRQYPCVCSRLEFGWDWESSTRQLLGVDPPQPPLPPLHPLVGL